MKKIVTIWGGNGQSNLLSAMAEYFPKGKYKIKSIVSMSDDGRTTGELMRKFHDELGLHLPPPGDLRRCLFMMSESPKRDEFQQYLETVIERDLDISTLTVWDYFRIVGAREDFKKYLEKQLSQSPLAPLVKGGSPAKLDGGIIEKNEALPQSPSSEGEVPSLGQGELLDFSLPLKSSVKGHKVGNILMANLYYNLEKDYHEMLKVMHTLLEVPAKIIPVTTQKAYIRAILWNGEVIETQDNISNVAAYSSGIADLELMEDSKHAYQHKDVFKAIKKADYIIISPGDLFTSTISNFVIGWVREVIGKSDAKIIYIGNTTNKWGETQWLTYLDFINKIERFLGRRIDIFICNNQKLTLSEAQKQSFQNNISVKWGDFLYLSLGEKDELTRRNIAYIETDLLDRKSLYKHDKKALAEILQQVLV